MNDSADIDQRIDTWIAATKALTGKPVWERETWNTEASADAIRQFTYGTDDPNPIWREAAAAAKTRLGVVQAPPGFLVSVLYPMLHGAPMAAPLASLIAGLEYAWFERIAVGDKLRAEPIQKDFYEKKNKAGRRLNFVISEVSYFNQNDKLVARATGTMIMATQSGRELLTTRAIHRYDAAELGRMNQSFEAETVRGAKPLRVGDVKIGDALPSIVRGPLSVGDLVSWYAGAGPSWKAGRWGQLDLKKKPHVAVENPATGTLHAYGQKHLDFHLAATGGFPAPFDVGVMRFTMVAPLLTNWMGDEGFLKRLAVRIAKPVLYGDAVTYSATVTAKDDATGVVSLALRGANQENEVTTEGEADVVLPR